MFWTYLRRELRRRVRQAVFIALGLALGIGLVITVTSAATGVQNAQAAVLHSLYGVGTDLTVTQPPKQGSGSGLTFGFKQQIKQVRSGQIAAGTKISDNELENTQYGTLTADQLAAVSRQQHVMAATGALTLNDITVAGTVPAAAQRNLYGRLLGCLHHCLATGQHYDETTAFPHRAAPPAAA